MIPRLAVYGLASTVLAGGVVSSALHSRANFYAAAVAVGRSSGALMVLANFALFNTICFGIALKKVFFGQLRAIEYEHLFERLWMFLTESLLAMTIFRDDFSAPFALMYCLLLFLKCFHWITADRVDYMDQIPPPGPPPLFHIRISLIIFILTLFDILLVTYSLETILIDGVSAMVLFASEFTILLASISGTALRYAVNLVDLRRARGRADAPSWEEKSMWLFYVDLAVDFVKLLTYLSFFTVILLHYGLPLHILRDVYMTLRSFLTRCGDLVRYRRATRDMDALYPDATAEELERSGDRTCIICREEMIPRGAQPHGQAADPGVSGPNETPKRLACGHVFHFHCLRSWLERQQSCPTCRRDVLQPQGTRRRPGTRDHNLPPPAAPGAVPQPPNANAQGNPDPAEIMRQGFEDYFRIPQLTRNGTAAAPTGVMPNAPAGSTAQGESEEDRRIQRGIWGGQVTPGRFFPAPLGAAPRLPPSLGTINGGRVGPRTNFDAGPSATAQRGQLSASANATAAGPSHHETGPALVPIPAGQSAISSSSPVEGTTTPTPTIPQSSALSTPQIGSGSTTPFSSQAPSIFTPTGELRIQSTIASGGEDARRAAAEAAMRRLGLGVNTPSLNGLERGSVTSNKIESSVESPRAFENGAVKGKGKELNPTAADDWDAPPKRVPYLTLSPDNDIAQSQSVDSKDRSLTSIGNISTETEAVNGLEERLRILREVDEVVWGLVGELSRVKSGWEAQDRVQPDDQSVTASSPEGQS